MKLMLNIIVLKRGPFRLSLLFNLSETFDKKNTELFSLPLEVPTVKKMRTMK